MSLSKKAKNEKEKEDALKSHRNLFSWYNVRVSVFVFVCTSEYVKLPVNGCGGVQLNKVNIREKNRRKRKRVICVCVIYVLFCLFSSTKIHCFFSVLLVCMFKVDVHSSGYSEIVCVDCRFAFHTIFFQSALFSALRFYFLLSPFALILHNFLPNDVPGFGFRFLKSRAISFMR